MVRAWDQRLGEMEDEVLREDAVRSSTFILSALHSTPQMLTKGSTGSWLRQWRRSRRMSEREPQATQPRRDDTSLLHIRHRPPSQRPLLPLPLSRPRPRPRPRPRRPRPPPRPRLRVAAGVGSFRSRRRQDRTVACSRPARHTSRRARRKRRNGTRASRSEGCAGWSATLRVVRRHRHNAALLVQAHWKGHATRIHPTFRSETLAGLVQAQSAAGAHTSFNPTTFRA